ncbi:MAG: hypothetical protein HQM10_02565 [Candidatus Riflebacteria bacterium]|nr:hypothetical protein [Candidatus Riflebacteria bacterium]
MAALCNALATSVHQVEINPTFVIDVLAGYQVPTSTTILPAASTSFRPLFANANGSYHHVSYAVLKTCIEPMTTSYTLLLFDQHDDARSLNANRQRNANQDKDMDCGNWVRFAMADLKNLSHVTFIGRAFATNRIWSEWADQKLFKEHFDMLPAVPISLYSLICPGMKSPEYKCRYDLFSWLLGWKGYQMEYSGYSRELFNDLLSRIHTKAVYISIDLDVIRWEEFDDPRWKHGLMSVAEVTDAISMIGKKFEIAGGDITGFPPFLKPDKAYNHKKNEASYLSLFKALEQAMIRGKSTQ